MKQSKYCMLSFQNTKFRKLHDKPLLPIADDESQNVYCNRKSERRTNQELKYCAVSFALRFYCTILALVGVILRVLHQVPPLQAITSAYYTTFT